MWFMVCRWPRSEEGDWARPHWCKLAQQGPWPVQKQFIRDRVWWRRLKPGCRIVGSVTIVWLTTESDDQSSLHCVIVSTDVMSDHIGCRDASRGGGCSQTSAYTSQWLECAAWPWVTWFISYLMTRLKQATLHGQWPWFISHWSLIHTTTTNTIKLCCLCRVRFGDVNLIPDNSRLSPTENFRVGKNHDFKKIVKNQIS